MQLKEFAPNKPFFIYYRCDIPFKFTGKIDKLTFNLGPPQYTEEAPRN